MREKEMNKKWFSPAKDSQIPLIKKISGRGIKYKFSFRAEALTVFMTLIRGYGNEYSWKSFVGEAAIAAR